MSFQDCSSKHTLERESRACLLEASMEITTGSAINAACLKLGEVQPAWKQASISFKPSMGYL